MLVKVSAKATRDHWEPSAVLFKVADPDAVPPLSESLRITKGDDRGMQISFPSIWLTERIEKSSFSKGVSESRDAGLPKSLIEGLHLALRAKHAQIGLTNSNRRVFDIAQSVGFKDATVFSRAFKNWTGQSPQEYRRTHRH